MSRASLRAIAVSALAFSGALSFVGDTAITTGEPTARAPQRARIPHLDGSGRATIVDIDPAIPGAREFARDQIPSIPARGEIQRMPLASPAPPAGAPHGRD